MQVLERTPEVLSEANKAFDTNPFFEPLTDAQRDQVIGKAGTIEAYTDSEFILKTGDPADFLFVVISGQVAVVVGEGEEQIELTCLERSQMVGEMAVILDEKRTASCVARGDTVILKLAREVFRKVMTAVPEAGMSMLRMLAERLKKTSRPPIHRDFRGDAPIPPVEVLRLIPMAFMQRHRVVPVRKQENNLRLGYCDRMDESLLTLVSQLLPSMKIDPVSIEAAYFEKIMQNYAGDAAAETTTGSSGTYHIDDLLSRLVAEGGSDLHLSAGQVPRWRIDGRILPIAGLLKLAPNEVFKMIAPIMRPESVEKFNKTGDEDFAYAMDKHSRFRINILRDQQGASAVFRHIPNTIFSLEELGMPDVLRRWAESPKGLVLVTGPTGSGKSTTLAAMLDHINRNHESHILTIEDPIEFVHQSRKSLVNQREVGVHTESFSRALRAALREDPDVVLVGEMRDLETISMALETANTGHLVMATLHTSTAISTINRIVDQFPADAQEQIRTGLADNLLGVCCQTLCRKIGGGRVPALEILVMDYAMSNMIREGRTHMLLTAMTTGQSRGNRLLNDDLLKLVNSGKITKEEALGNAVDYNDMSRRLGLTKEK
ncbi:MAG: PilT/PilU family type 4a pilus ATPase [Candidatus Riflebacteria bacterium]|nr:PilT/PilU family type 4a pilus ATPase [Candidatus Riflebacteria bacterium]